MERGRNTDILVKNRSPKCRRRQRPANDKFAPVSNRALRHSGARSGVERGTAYPMILLEYTSEATPAWRSLEERGNTNSNTHE